MSMWTDIAKRCVYITRPKMWTAKKEKDFDARWVSKIGVGEINGRSKLKGGDGKFWKIVIVESGETFIHDKGTRISKPKMAPAKRNRRPSRFQGYSSVGWDKLTMGIIKKGKKANAKKKTAKKGRKGRK